MTDWLSWYVAWQHSHWPVCIEETNLSVKLLEEKGDMIKEKTKQEWILFLRPEIPFYSFGSNKCPNELPASILFIVSF